MKELEDIHEQLVKFISNNIETSLQARLFAKTINLIYDIKLQTKKEVKLENTKG